MARVKKTLPAAEPSTRADALIELGLTDDAGDEAVRRAFRMRLKTAHPDLNGGTDVLLRRLILARDLLTKNADRLPAPTERLGNSRPDDTPMRLIVTLAQAITGGEAFVEVPALEISGAEEELTSLTQMKTLRIPLPAGLRNGDIIAVKTDSVIHDDRLFRVQIAAEDGTRIWGDDIWMTARIEPHIFAMGGLATILTPHGPHDVAIDKDSATGSSLCIKGLGLPATEVCPAGNLHIRLDARPSARRPFGEALGAFRGKWVAA